MFAATFQVVLLFGIWIKYRQMWCAVLLWRQRTVCAHIPVSTTNSVIWHIASSRLSTYHSVLSHPVYSLIITVPSHTRTRTHARTHTHTHTNPAVHNHHSTIRHGLPFRITTVLGRLILQYKTCIVNTSCLEYEFQQDEYINISHDSSIAFAVFLRLM